MEHVVFFPQADGSPAFRRVPSLDEAVRLVEHLHNVEGVADVSVHSLTEVPLAIRTYYRVEVPTDVIPEQAGPEPVPAPAPEPVALAPVEDLLPVAELAPLVDAEPAVEPVAEEEQPEPLAQLAPVLEAVEEPAEEPAEEPVLVASNGHNPASLGFFA